VLLGLLLPWGFGCRLFFEKKFYGSFSTSPVDSRYPFPCLHYFGLYILISFSKHVKSVHLLADFVSQVNQVILYL